MPIKMNPDADPKDPKAQATDPKATEPKATDPHASPNDNASNTNASDAKTKKNEDSTDNVLVKMPDGSYEMRSRADVDAMLKRQNKASNAPVEEEPEKEYYVTLADGSTRKSVKESELPGYAGTNAPFGYIDDMQITAVYPA